MLYDIIAIRDIYTSGDWDAVEEAVNDRNLVFNAASLSKIGFESFEEIDQAVERAMALCYHNGVSPREHFKTFFIADEDTHTLRKDWKLSRLAYTLVLFNGTSNNPVIARVRFEIIKQYVDSGGKHS
jgi:hypothetical protein